MERCLSRFHERLIYTKAGEGGGRTKNLSLLLGIRIVISRAREFSISRSRGAREIYSGDIPGVGCKISFGEKGRAGVEEGGVGRRERGA